MDAQIRKAKAEAEAVVAASAEAEAPAKTATEGGERMLSEDEGGDMDMPDVGHIEVEKDSALAKLLAAASVAGMDLQAVRAELAAQSALLKQVLERLPAGSM